MDEKEVKRALLNIYPRLFSEYGPQHWWPARTRFEVITGAILTQSAAWTNVEKAIENLKQAGALSPGTIRRMSQDKLAMLIHPCGYYNTKARKLKAFAGWLGEQYSDDLDRLFAQDIEELRRQLLNVYGIGEETADSIILYAGNKPIFVIDAYTRRIVNRLGLAPNINSYTALQRLFMANLPADTTLFNEYHALLVRLAKEVCRTSPLCRQCCLNPGRRTGSEPSEGNFPCRKIHK
ncbi:MAG: endonuclease [Chloroflexi bacterium RBG_13_51_52]|nr:MAG: endonuclease [Chloroflexi bacterium RBG_13_51_52]